MASIPAILPTSKPLTIFVSAKTNPSHLLLRSRQPTRTSFRTTHNPIAALAEAAASVADPVPVEITWQIVVGSLAGVVPFMVAGVEFGKRIVAQRRCEVCGGSGLVLRDDSYLRCPGCGGFLPWQSWERFFSG